MACLAGIVFFGSMLARMVRGVRQMRGAVA
jgi:hypothetical protein